MRHFIYNTDAGAIVEQPKPRYRCLIDGGFAAAGGDRQKFGEQFAQLDGGEFLFMYENGVGIVATGLVKEHWNGESYSEPMYYTTNEMQGLTGGAAEYRVAVDWLRDISDSPIGVQEIRQRLGYESPWAPRGVLWRINQPEALVALIAQLPAPQAKDLMVPSPERVATTVYRIIRDTQLARRVKEIHQWKCQICGRTISLSDGTFYAEAHHIKPLGKPHNGPDEVANIVCVCPNHHTELDYGVIRIVRSELASAGGHLVSDAYIEYHNQRIFSD